MIRLIIIADDFTGGLDTGVQFAQKGIRTRVVTDWKTDYQEAAQGCEVLVVVAETRHIRPEDAYRIVSGIVQKSIPLNIPFIYKKTDSGLRGNIGAELNAVLHASGAAVLPFLPSMPSLGRITAGGIHYISGVPVAQSIFGKDPFEPVTESDVCQLLRHQCRAPVTSGSIGHFPDSEGIWVIDAGSEEDLVAAGQSLHASGRLHVMAGCAGFAAVLPDLLGLMKGPVPALPNLAPGLLVLCGSVNPITQHQLDHAENAGFARVHILPEQKLTPGYFDTDPGRETLRIWREQYEKTPWFILDANDADPENAESAAFIHAHGMTMESARQCISGSLGQILPALLESPVNRSILITGGDTLLECMNHLHVSQMEPVLEVFPGVVLSTFETAGKMQYVITKSGGFGEEKLLCHLKDLIMRQP